MYLYEVRLERGRSNPEHQTFYENVMKLGAKEPDFGGINNMCIIRHHMDVVTIQILCSSNLKKESEVTVEEITRNTLDVDNGKHKMHTNIVEKYFLPHHKYPNIE